MRVKTLTVVVFILLTLFPFALLAQGLENLSVCLAPGAHLPLAYRDQFGIGIGAGLSVDYRLPFLPLLAVGGGISYGLLPTLEQSRLSLVAFDVGAGVNVEILPKLTISLAARGGYHLALYGGAVGSGPVFGGQTRIEYRLHPAFGLGIDATYQNFWSIPQSRPLAQDLSVNLAATFHLGSAGQSRLEIRDVKFSPVFPVFYKYYDENAVGQLSIRNGEAGIIKDVKITFFVKQYMDKPKVCGVLKEIKAGAETSIPLYALFTDNVLGITEGTTVMAQIAVDYLYNDEKRVKEYVQSLEIENRNAMTWDDDRKAASFITAKDPAVLKFAKGVAAAIRDIGAGSLDGSVVNALGLFESLSLYGLNYVKDPSSPYEQYSRDSTVIDFLQFPSQTLTYKAGDCDDLSILFCALLESIGIETAFITIPGHIFMAFALQMDSSEAVQAFSRPEDVIILEGKPWIPVEITMVRDGFLKAWQEGAKEWRENSKAGKARLFPIHDAWNTYRPVGILSTEGNIEVPRTEKISSTYLEALRKFVEREIGPKAQSLIDEISKSKGEPRLTNKLGVLYARYGLYEKAELEFKKVIAKVEDASALVNLGNIAFLRKDMRSALVFYERAYRKEPRNAKVLINIARTQYQLENDAAVKDYFQRARELDPGLAGRYEYLGTDSMQKERAGTSMIDDTTIWVEIE